jgi:Flp pilus assembly protein TadB
MFTYSRPESVPPAHLWMALATSVAVLGAMVALMCHDYWMADAGIILGNVLFLFLTVRRYRERRRQDRTDVARAKVGK